MKADLKIDNSQGFLDIDFDEENTNQSLCINFLTKNARVLFDKNYNFFEKGGTIGDVLVNESQISGSLIVKELKNQAQENRQAFISNELLFRLNKLKKIKEIESFEILSISFFSQEVQIELNIDNEVLPILKIN